MQCSNIRKQNLLHASQRVRLLSLVSAFVGDEEQDVERHSGAAGHRRIVERSLHAAQALHQELVGVRVPL